MPLSPKLTKSFLKSVKSDPALAKKVHFLPNGKINRSSLRSTYLPRETWLTKKLLKESPFSPSPKAGVTIGKAIGKGPAKILPDGGIKIPRTSAAMHEIGHAMDHEAIKNLPTFRNYIKTSVSPHSAVKKTVGHERAANRNAIQKLREVGASPADIVEYRKDVKPGFNSYRKQAIRTHATKGILSDLLTGKKAEVARKTQIAIGSPMGFTETKKVLRENPYLRGYGFQQIADRLTEMSEKITRLLEFSYT